jgi:hypothetical protein
MILLSLGFLAFGISDLVSGPPGKGDDGDADGFPIARELLGVAGGAAGAGTVAALAGLPAITVAVVVVAGLVALSVWVFLDRRPPRGKPLVPLAWLVGMFALLFSISSLGDEIQGPLRDWYAGLDFAFTSHLGVGQFVLACGAALFALASCNRVVVLVLALAGPALKEEVSSLKGGRLLGPMERLIVAAAILAGGAGGGRDSDRCKGGIALSRDPERSRFAVGPPRSRHEHGVLPHRHALQPLARRRARCVCIRLWLISVELSSSR